MPESSYSRLTSSPDLRLTDLAQYPLADRRTSTKPAAAQALGRPQRKPLFDILDIAAVTISIASLISSICVVTPRLSLPWRLGFEGQIIVIGFLLSIMNLCMKRVVPTLFLMIEARWGRSSLQNYEAIMRNTVTLSQTHILWRTGLFILIALPLGLSVAYKRFTGGRSGAIIHNTYDSYYGLAPPPMGDFNIVNNSLYLMINATVPFLAASSSDDILPSFANLPMAYGFNTLLLSNTSAALLDVPVPDYVSSIQQNLSASESWNISATVNGTVTTLNTSIAQYRDNDNFWEESFYQAYDFGGLSSFELYNEYDLGVLVGYGSELVGPYCLAGFYSGSVNGASNFFNVNDTDSQIFRSSALMFNTRRQRCAGRWEVTRTNVRLLNGSCSGVETNQSVFWNSIPFYLDAMPVMVHALTRYAPTAPRNSSQWLMPAFTINIAAMYWGRMTFMNAYLSGDYASNGEIYYPAKDEYITSTNATLDASWLLYLVLALQPILTISVFFIASCFYHVPVGKGFGLVAILAGVEKESLALLKGAALSGELRRSVSMDIGVRYEGKVDAMGGNLGKIQYSLCPKREEKIVRLQRRMAYG